ncbi:MAG: DUF1566 domain-containing protein [Bacteroidetes bacterium]|nr:DUF1566 domain-containing protein [Bacteroidota bacterium]
MKNLIASILSCFLFVSGMMAQVGINSDNLPPDPSAGVDVRFSVKGLLPPRVELSASNVADPVVFPAEGLFVYNTATAGNPPFNVVPGYYFWDGIMWKSFVASAGTNGQTLRNDGGNWIANSNLYNDGSNIGIGLINPTHKLTIGGTTEALQLIGPGTLGSAAKLNFGDADYAYISEDTHDHLLVHASAGAAIMAGYVGIGTTALDQQLTVAGKIQTTSGGVMFPNNTIQTSAVANVHAIGETYGGGVVFYVYDDGQHGLIADNSSTISFFPWNNGSFTTTNALRDDVFAGKFNTERININQGAGSYAAQICASYQGGGYSDWYLPSKYELNLLYQQKSVLPILSSGGYWSSTEFNADYAWMQYFTSGLQGFTGKASSYICVLAIRAF